MDVKGKLDYSGYPEVNGDDKLVGVHSTTADPTATDDSTQGYYEGYIWVAQTSGTVFICEDATATAAVWTAIDGAGGGFTSPLTTKGDLHTYDTDDARLPVGADKYILEADSAQSTGLKYSKKPWSRSVYTYNMITVTGVTWNAQGGIDAPGATSLYDRHRFFAFAGGNNAHEGCYTNIVLPQEYVAGTDIKVTLILTANTAASTMAYYVGVCQPTAGDIFGGATEATTEWVLQTPATATGFPVIKQSYTFDGTNMSPGDPISIMVYRDPNDAGDTANNVDTYLNQLIVEPV